MKSKSLEIAQDIPYNRTVLKRISDNFWVPCKKSSMANPVILLKDRKCHFCKIKENNKLKYGPLYALNRIVAHYYCVLCSTRMKQNGKDNEGIMGFLLRDINLELRRSKKISCAYCREKNATVECAYPGCKKIFHFPCGLQRGALSRFRNDFISFCCKHRPKQKIPKKIIGEAVKTELICAICYEEVQPTDRKDNLWAPCCLRSWYHRNCVQKLAHSSGYFFRCATCNDADKFKSHMEDNGIFVPQQDASWELVPNAYEELLVRHNRCDAEECKCPNGREENVEDTRWEITLCRFCGSQGIHVGCGELKFTDPQWECPTCQSIMKTDSKSTKDEEEIKGDITVKKSSPKSNDQPEPAPRKRKLSVQSKPMNKRKKEKVEGEKPSKNDDDDSDAEETKSGDEFYIRLPGRKSDKPHTVTKPDEESDEEVDVISVDTAWLMVEEVLSRVKPGPLSYKLKFLRKKVFSYHFDPFDIREEIETIDLASDSEDNTSVLEIDKKSDTDSDIEFIGEVRDLSKKEKSRQEVSVKMEPNMPYDDLQGIPAIPDLAEGLVAPDVPDLSDTETEVSEILEGARASEGSGAADEPMVSDVSQGSEAHEVYEGIPEEPDVRPSTSTVETEFESKLVTVYEHMTPYDEDDEKSYNESELEYLYNRRGFGDVEYEVQGEKSEEGSDDDDDIFQEAIQRQVGRKHPGSGIEQSKGKRARTITTTHDISAVDSSDQCQVSTQNLSPTDPADSPQVSISDPSPSVIYSVEQTFEDNQTIVKAINLTSLRIMDQSGLPTMLLPNTSYFLIDYGDDGGQTLLNASLSPTTSTTFICEPSTSGMAASLPSTSGMASPFPSTSGMPASLPGTPVMAASLPGTPVMATSLPSTSGMSLSMASTSGMATSLPCLSERQDESGSLTPLPSFQFLSSLHTNMSPLPSSNSSGSLSLNQSQRVLPPIEISSSSEGSNDVFIKDDNVSQKSAP